MRFIVYGAGAVGGVVGGRLFESGADVVLVARGPHLEALRSRGLTIESPKGNVTVSVPAVADPAEVDFVGGEMVLLAMKSHDTVAALHRLGLVAPASVTVACLQNGVQNERAALRRFPDVQAVTVMCPAGYTEPGVVQAWSAPTPGILDVGRYPLGIDEATEALAAAFEDAGFVSLARPDVMRWKYTKLIKNLGNAVEALCPDRGAVELVSRAREEGKRCLAAAGIDYASDDEDLARRGDILQLGDISGRVRGGSTWQSLTRGLGTVEVDYLNGEIVLLGRLRGVATPVNALLQQLTNQQARRGAPPGAMTSRAVLALLDRG